LHNSTAALFVITCGARLHLNKPQNRQFPHPTSCANPSVPQATDDSIKDGLTTTINNLKQLLLGTLLWNPLTMMEVGGHNLESGEPVMPDAKQSEDCISGIGLSPEQEDVLVIIGGEHTPLWLLRYFVVEQQAYSLHHYRQPSLLAAGTLAAEKTAVCLAFRHETLHRSVVYAMGGRQLHYLYYQLTVMAWCVERGSVIQAARNDTCLHLQHDHNPALTPACKLYLCAPADLYNTQVAALEANHSSLSQTLDAEMAAGNGSGVAATIMLASSNMHRLLAIHQLFHVAIMHNLVNQQLAHLCVRCFPRFPCMQDLLNALARVRVQNSRRGADMPDARGHSKSSKDHAVSTHLAGHQHAVAAASAAAAAAAAEHKALQKLGFVEPVGLRQGRVGDGSNKPSQSRSGIPSSSTGAAASGRDESGRSMWGGDAEQQQQQQQGMAAPRAMPAACDLADAVKSPNKDWDTQELRSAAGTPTKLEQGAVAGQGASHKRPRSPAGGGNCYSNGNRNKKAALSAAAAAALAGFGGPGGTAAAAAANNRDRQQQAGRGRASDEGDANLAAVAAAAAAGIPVDPAAAAALPLDHLQAAQQLPGGSSAASPAQLVQQLTAVLSAADGPASMLQLLATQPKLAALLLQQQPQLLAALQESMAQQQQHSAEQAAWQQQQQASFPDLLQANGGQPGGTTAAQHGSSAQDRACLDDSSHAQAGQWQNLGQQAGGGSNTAAGAQGLSSGGQTLEMLPPSVAASKVTASSPVQGLLQSVATLLQACTSVSDAATAAIESGHSEFVSSAVSAAEAALATALKSLQEQKARCNNSSSSAGHASTQPATAAGPPAPAPQSKQGLPPAGPSSNSKLQPPVGIPVPSGPQHTSQGLLPLSLSLALSGLGQQQAPEAAAYPHSHAMLLAGLGLDQRGAAAAAAAASEGLPQQQLQGSWPGTKSRKQTHPQQGSGRGAPSQEQQQQGALQQQQQTVAGALQQLSDVGHNPASVEQLLQTLQQPQQLTPEVAAALTQLVCAAASNQQASAAAAAAESPYGLAALLQQLQTQQAYAQGLKPVPSSGAMGAAQQAVNASAAGGYGPGAHRARQALSAAVYDAAAAADCFRPASAGYPAAHMAAFSQRLASQYAAAAQASATAADAAILAASQAAVAAGLAGAPAGKAVVDATGQVKEDSPSAGSSSSAVGQSTQQPGDAAAGAAGAAASAAAVAAATAGLQQQLPAVAGGSAAGDLQQQLDMLARAGAGGMGGAAGGQVQGPGAGQAEAFMSSVMQLMRGQVGADVSYGGVGSVASILQTMAAAGGHLGDLGQQQQHPQLTPPALSATLAAGPSASAAPSAAMLQAWRPSAAAAAATEIPPAAAAAMVVGQAAAAAAAAEARSQGPRATEYAEMEFDAVSALEMLAAAAVTTQQEEGPSHRMGRTRDA
jgi:hypothetical protein